MPETANIPKGTLVETVTVTECPYCGAENRYYWMPGMKPIPQDFMCLNCKRIYTLHSDE